MVRQTPRCPKVLPIIGEARLNLSPKIHYVNFSAEVQSVCECSGAADGEGISMSYCLGSGVGYYLTVPFLMEILY